MAEFLIGLGLPGWVAWSIAALVAAVLLLNVIAGGALVFIWAERKIAALQVEHPDAELIAHPECEASLLAKAQFVGSTSALLKHVIESPKKTFIIATEEGILHQMRKQAPGKELIPAPPNQNCACNECPYMKLNTLEKLYAALRDETPEITMREELRSKAEAPLQRMLDWSTQIGKNA